MALPEEGSARRRRFAEWAEKKDILRVVRGFLAAFIDKSSSELKLVLDTHSFQPRTDGEVIWTCVMDEELELPEEYWLTFLLGNTVHECGHINSSNFCDMQKIAKWYGKYLQGKWTAAGHTGSVVSSASEIARSILNAVEDGRIEAIQVRNHPGVFQALHFSNLVMRDNAVIEEKADTKKGEYAHFFNCILCYAKTGLYPDGAECYAGTDLEDTVLRISPLIDTGVQAVTSENCRKVVEQLLKEISPYLIGLLEDEDLQQEQQNKVGQPSEYSGNGEREYNAPSSDNPLRVDHPERQNQGGGQSKPNSGEQQGNSRNQSQGQPGNGSQSNAQKSSSSNQSGTQKSDPQQPQADAQSGADGGDQQEESAQNGAKQQDSSAGEAQEDRQQDEPEDNSQPDSADSSQADEPGEEQQGSGSNEDPQKNGDAQADAQGDEGDCEGQQVGDPKESADSGDQKESQTEPQQAGQGDSNSQSSPSNSEGRSSDQDGGNASQNSGSQDGKGGSTPQVVPPKKGFKDVQHNAPADGKSMSEYSAILSKFADGIRQAQEKEAVSQGAISQKDLNAIIGKFAGETRNVKQTPLKIRGTSPLPPALKRQADTLRREITRVLSERKGEQRGLKRGNLDAKNVWKYGFNDNSMFMKKQNEELGSAAFYLLIDNSGSTISTAYSVDDKPVPLFQAERAGAAVIEEAARGLVPCKVALFNTRGNCTVHAVIRDFKDQSRTNRSWNSLAEVGPDGCNADALHIRIASLELLKRRERKKVLFILSDGRPSSFGSRTDGEFWKSGQVEVRAAVQDARKRGVVVIPIMLGDANFFETAISDYQLMYGKDIVKCLPQQLTDKLSRLFKAIITG